MDDRTTPTIRPTIHRMLREPGGQDALAMLEYAASCLEICETFFEFSRSKGKPAKRHHRDFAARSAANLRTFIEGIKP